jgi:hypothetical protein
VKSGPSRIGSSTYSENSVIEGILVATAARLKILIVTALGLCDNGRKAVRRKARQEVRRSPAIIAAIADGRRPTIMAEDEDILYDFCTELLYNQSVSDPTYAKAVAKFGEPGVVEAASLEGYYTFLSMVMNTARSPMPAGVKPALAPFPK